MNYFSFDGPGSGNMRFQENPLYWKRSEQYEQPQGSTYGHGLMQNVKNAAFFVKARMGLLEKKDFKIKDGHEINPLQVIRFYVINELSKINGQSIGTLNLLGWSRGAVTCIFLTNILNEDFVPRFLKWLFYQHPVVP